MCIEKIQQLESEKKKKKESIYDTGPGYGLSLGWGDTERGPWEPDWAECRLALPLPSSLPLFVFLCLAYPLPLLDRVIV